MKESAKPLYLILGESGSGKDTIVRRVCEMLRVRQVVSYTTRPRRKGEVNGREHYFISDGAFRRKLPDMIAKTTFDGYRYGATVGEVNGRRRWDAPADLYVIDPAGAKHMNRARMNRPIFEVYISVPETTRMYRMFCRGEERGDVERRIQHDRKAFAAYRESGSPDYVIENNGIMETPVLELAQIIMKNWPQEPGK